MEIALRSREQARPAYCRASSEFKNENPFQGPHTHRDAHHGRRGTAQRILASMALLLSFVSFPASAGADDPSPVERELLDSTNRERALNHLAPLKWDAALASAARTHCNRMAQEGRISHELPGEPELSARAIQSGVRFSKVGENVGDGPSLLEIHVGWMNSPGHRGNILDPVFNSIGIGVSERNGQFFATQDFSRSIQSLSFEEQEKLFSALLQAEGLTVERDPAKARKACESGYADIDNGKLSIYEFHYVTSDLTSLPKRIKQTIHRGQYHVAAVGACDGEQTRSGMYRLSVLLY